MKQIFRYLYCITTPTTIYSIFEKNAISVHPFAARNVKTDFRIKSTTHFENRSSEFLKIQSRVECTIFLEQNSYDKFQPLRSFIHFYYSDTFPYVTALATFKFAPEAPK